MDLVPHGLGEVEEVVVLGLGPVSCSYQCKALSLGLGAALVPMVCSPGHGGMGRLPLPCG